MNLTMSSLTAIFISFQPGKICAPPVGVGDYLQTARFEHKPGRSETPAFSHHTAARDDFPLGKAINLLAKSRHRQ
jgi:hypothetical protein